MLILCSLLAHFFALTLRHNLTAKTGRRKGVLSYSLQKKRVIMGYKKMAEIHAHSVYYIFRDYLIILTSAHMHRETTLIS